MYKEIQGPIHHLRKHRIAIEEMDTSELDKLWFFYRRCESKDYPTTVGTILIGLTNASIILVGRTILQLPLWALLLASLLTIASIIVRCHRAAVLNLRRRNYQDKIKLAVKRHKTQK